MVLLLLVFTPAVRAEVRYPARPAQNESVLDLAGMLEAEDARVIREWGAALLAEKGFPLVVVTIGSLAEYDADGMSMEGYARGLFDTWGVGRPEHNYGVLLLINKGDRKARIELGAAWGREHDAVCGEIMDTLIIPSFKRGEFSAGILAGAEGLDRMARGEEIPSRPAGSGVGSLATGGLGWHSAWVLLPSIVILCMIYYRIIHGSWEFLNRNSRRSGRWAGPDRWGNDSSGGGSFGGGSSGGGGASGSW